MKLNEVLDKITLVVLVASVIFNTISIRSLQNERKRMSNEIISINKQLDDHSQSLNDHLNAHVREVRSN